MQSVTRKVDVTGEDIGKGCRLDTGACPVALAVHRVFPEFDSLEVYEKEVQVCFQGWVRDFPLPEEAEQFIRDFDKNKEVQPFSFGLTVYI